MRSEKDVYLYCLVIGYTIVFNSEFFTTFSDHISPQLSPPIRYFDGGEDIKGHNSKYNQRKISIKVDNKVNASLRQPSDLTQTSTCKQGRRRIPILDRR